MPLSSDCCFLRLVDMPIRQLASKIFCIAERICCSYFWVFVHYLLQVTRDAYAVILAGGTLQPIEETRLRMCPSLAPADIKFFTCNHIVPPESILPIAVTRGPSGMTFDFSYSSRSSPSMVCTFYLIYNIPYPISFCHSSIHCEIWITYIYFAEHLLSNWCSKLFFYNWNLIVGYLGY